MYHLNVKKAKVSREKKKQPVEPELKTDPTVPQDWPVYSTVVFPWQR